MSSTDLKKVGLKITLPRLKILELMEKSDRRHWSAEEIHQMLIQQQEDIGLATVYRVLGQFESAGLVNRHNFESGYAVYELERGVHHDHLVCVKCSRVDEFSNDVIEEHQNQVAKKFGYKVTDHSLNIYGLCPRCQSQ